MLPPWQLVASSRRPALDVVAELSGLLGNSAHLLIASKRCDAMQV